jgi:hypothetical protein
MQEPSAPNQTAPVYLASGGIAKIPARTAVTLFAAMRVTYLAEGLLIRLWSERHKSESNALRAG